METETITNDELVEIFNNIINSHPFLFNLFNPDSSAPSYRNTEVVKDYYDKKQFDIELNLIVFENIPKTKIYIIIEDFIQVIARFKMSKRFKLKNSKKLQKESYTLIKKDIKIIEKYQDIIFNYTSDYEWNLDSDFSILTPELDSIYHKNKLLLEELKTKRFNILDPCRYGGTNLYDSSKKPIKHFFKELQKTYTLKTLYIKQMIDIL